MVMGTLGRGRRALTAASRAVDDGARVGRQMIAAPSHVPVGPHQHEAALVELADRRIRDRHDGEGHLSAKARSVGA